MNEITIQVADETMLFMRHWPVLREERQGAALILHGLGEHSGRYGHVAAALNGVGLEVWCYDQRGSGRSPGKYGDIPHHDSLLDDAKHIFDRLAAEAGRAPFLIGHSMGGTLAARAVTGGWIKPRGLVLSSPSLQARMSRFQRWQVALGRRLTPGLAISHGLPVQAVSRDPQVVADYLADPLVHDRITPRLAYAILHAGECARRDAAQVGVPTLVLVAGADQLIDPAGARAFAGQLPAGQGTLHWYEGFYHEVFNEPARDRERVLHDLCTWVAAQL